MWVEKSLFSSREYEKKVCLPKPYTFISGYHRATLQAKYPIPKSKQLYKRHEDIYKKFRDAQTIWEKAVQESKKFGISLAGIRVKKEEISVDPKKLESNVFYLFSYKDEQYVARKTDEDVVEIYEVIE